MNSINTEVLRRRAEALSKEAYRYNHRLPPVEACIVWLRQQEFKEARRICQVLEKQCEELRTQKRNLLLMADVMQRICEEYERTEQRIIEEGEGYQGFTGYVEAVDLQRLRRQLSSLGINMEEL